MGTTYSPPIRLVVKERSTLEVLDMAVILDDLPSMSDVARAVEKEYQRLRKKFYDKGKYLIQEFYLKFARGSPEEQYVNEHNPRQVGASEILGYSGEPTEPNPSPASYIL